MPDTQNEEMDQLVLFLADEVFYFYEELFSVPAPKVIVDRYIEANLKLLPERSIEVRKLVLKRVDIEAVEMAWRRENPKNILTRKLHILVYLAESIPENFPLFFNQEKRWLYAVLLLARRTFCSVGKLLKGKFLMMRYHLV